MVHRIPADIGIQIQPAVEADGVGGDVPAIGS